MAKAQKTAADNGSCRSSSSSSNGCSCRWGSHCCCGGSEGRSGAHCHGVSSVCFLCIGSIMGLLIGVQDSLDPRKLQAKQTEVQLLLASSWDLQWDPTPELSGLKPIVCWSADYSSCCLLESRDIDVACWGQSIRVVTTPVSTERSAELMPLNTYAIIHHCSPGLAVTSRVSTSHYN